MESWGEGFSIRELSHVLEASESGYYRWRSNKVTAHEQRDVQLAAIVKWPCPKNVETKLSNF